MARSVTSAKKRPTLDHKTLTDKLSLSCLESHFHMPLKEVADKFGVSMTFFKKVCRAHGIRRWPRRKVKQIQKIYEKLGESPIQMTVKELEALKAKEERDANGPQRRIPVWDSTKRRKISGMAAPLEYNLPLYLREHPQMEVYNGQDASHCSIRPAKRMKTAPTWNGVCDEMKFKTEDPGEECPVADDAITTDDLLATDSILMSVGSTFSTDELIAARDDIFGMGEIDSTFSGMGDVRAPFSVHHTAEDSTTLPATCSTQSYNSSDISSDHSSTESDSTFTSDIDSMSEEELDNVLDFESALQDAWVRDDFSTKAGLSQTNVTSELKQHSSHDRANTMNTDSDFTDDDFTNFVSSDDFGDNWPQESLEQLNVTQPEAQQVSTQSAEKDLYSQGTHMSICDFMKGVQTECASLDNVHLPYTLAVQSC